MILQAYLSHAFGLSLCIHLLVLLLPVGRSALVAGQGETLLIGQRDFAPLTILLGPHAPPTSPPYRSSQETIAQPPLTAPAISTEGMGSGHPGNDTGPDSSPNKQNLSEIAGIPVPYYFAPEELSQRARIVRDIDPTLGALADIPGQGRVILKLWVNETGGVDRVATVSSTLDGMFEQAVHAQFLSVRFQPAERAGIAVKSLMRIEVLVLPRSRLGRDTAGETPPYP